MRRRLTTKTIENLNPAEKRYERSDGGGPLRIVVQPTGHKAFAIRYRRPNSGKTAKLTLEPPWPALTLASARKAAADALHDLAEGNDPAKTRAEAKIKDAAAKADTVAAVCQEYLGREGHKLRTVDQRVSVLRRLVYPAMGERPVASIKRSEIIHLLDKIEDEKGPRMADVALSVLRRIFNWHALRNDDFSSPIIRGMGRTNTKERERSHVLDDAELRAIWTASLADEVFGALIRFLLLSAARRSEAAGMRWNEVDAKGLWTLPAGRSKTGLDAHALNAPSPYEMPAHAVSHGAAYGPAGLTDSLAELAAWFGNAALSVGCIQRQMIERKFAASPVRCWPHHFDIATLTTLPARNTDVKGYVGT